LVSEDIIINLTPQLINGAFLLITTIITGIFSLIAVGKFPKVHPTGKLKLIIKIVSIIMIIMLIVGLGLFLAPVVYGLTHRPSLSITSPANGAVVGMEQQIGGVATNTPEGSKVWVAIRVGDRYYPQSEPRIDNEGRWTCNARFGGVDDGGLVFDIIALFANREAQIALTENSEFLVFPPLGTTDYVKITVTRETYTTAPKSTPSPTASSKPSITITAPANNAKVDMYEWISGTSQNIPNGQELWIVVKVDGLYFPHKVETINTDGTWKQNVQIGQKDEGDKSFELIAVLANSVAQATTQEWYKNPYDLQNLPAGMTQHSTITVTRRGTLEKSPAEPSVTITSPANNNAVNMQEWISGTSQNIPNGYQLWIVVHEGNLYFPMVDRVQINTDGTWRYSTTIGKEDDHEKTFDIIAVLANSAAQATTQEWYKNPYDLQNLPAGMTQHSTITVTRL
jgi:hypothetical protein